MCFFSVHVCTDVWTDGCGLGGRLVGDVWSMYLTVGVVGFGPVSRTED